MQPVASHEVWKKLSDSERKAIVERIVRVLAEEVDNERIRQDQCNVSFRGACQNARCCRLALCGAQGHNCSRRLLDYAAAVLPLRVAA